MGQSRELAPFTVYLPQSAIALMRARAERMSVAQGTLLRMVLLGQAPPLNTAGDLEGQPLSDARYLQNLEAHFRPVDGSEPDIDVTGDDAAGI